MVRIALPIILASVAFGCGHKQLREAKRIAHDDGQRVIAALESYENEHGEYPLGLEAVGMDGSRVASMTYVRDGHSFTLVVGASSTRAGASCTRKAGDQDWSCRRWRN